MALKNLFDSSSRNRRDQPFPPDERSLRLLIRALDSNGVPLTKELIHQLAVVVEAWPPAEPRA